MLPLASNISAKEKLDPVLGIKLCIVAVEGVIEVVMVVVVVVMVVRGDDSSGNCKEKKLS